VFVLPLLIPLFEDGFPHLFGYLSHTFLFMSKCLFALIETQILDYKKLEGILRSLSPTLRRREEYLSI